MGNCRSSALNEDPLDGPHTHIDDIADSSKRYDRPTIGDLFPNLKGSTQFDDDFDLYEYMGNDKWGLIFMHPGDFTPVCTTELAAAASLIKEFDKRNVSIIGYSCNDAQSHRDWIVDIKEATGQQVSFPIFCDPDRSFSKWLGILDTSNRDTIGLPLTVRSVYILKPDKEVALVITYPASTGRNMNEIIRVIDSLQLNAQHNVATPANWIPGDRVLVDHPLSDKEAEARFGKDKIEYIEVPSERFSGAVLKHYLRYIDDPSVTAQPQEGS
jgi:alkyl hydroperoxide reductase subunit AhpC